MKKVEKKYRFGQMNSVEDFSRILGADGLDFPVSQDLSVLASPLSCMEKPFPTGWESSLWRALTACPAARRQT